MKYLGIDQYGSVYRIKQHPRKELLETFQVTRANKMYIDEVNGGTKHIGYVIGSLWIRLYEVKPYKQ